MWRGTSTAHRSECSSPRSLPAALQPGAAAHEADRAAAVGAEGGLAAGGHRARLLLHIWGFWGFTHPFQNSGVPGVQQGGTGAPVPVRAPWQTVRMTDAIREYWDGQADPALWGKEISDERYLILSRS